jgi:hypothetical protein
MLAKTLDNELYELLIPDFRVTAGKVIFVELIRRLDGKFHRWSPQPGSKSRQPITGLLNTGIRGVPNYNETVIHQNLALA